MGIGMGMGFGMEAFSSSSTTATATATATSNAYLYGLPSTDTLHIDDLLDFSTQEGFFDADNNNHNNNNQQHQHHLLPQSGIPYSASATGNCSYLTENSNSVGSHLATFPDDLYMPSEEAAELEWLSKFVEDSFSDMPFPPPGTIGNFSDVPPATADTNSNSYNNHNAVPGRARSKRSRAPATTTHLTTTATTWSSLPPPQLSTSPSSSSSSSETKHRASSGGKKKDVMTMILTQGGGAGAMVESGGGVVRKCTHCSSEKTPQWRTGPLGPKTLCNACGVRYKSGRLVPEYRPASSPTFMLTQHSNSHRKVMELRRQKELLLRHHNHSHHQQRRELSPPNSNTTASTTTRPDLLLRDYEVC